MDTSRDLFPELRVTIQLTDEDWNSIRPKTVEYNDRDYRVLRQGWTDDRIWKEHKLSCYYTTTAKLMKILANISSASKASLLSALLKSICVLWRGQRKMDLPFVFQRVTPEGLGTVKKRQLRELRRNKIAKEVTCQSTYAWRRNKANDLMEFGDPIPSNLYREEVMRKAEQTERDLKLGLPKVTEAAKSVNKLKYRPRFVGTIHKIGYDKFFTSRKSRSIQKNSVTEKSRRPAV